MKNNNKKFAVLTIAALTLSMGGNLLLQNNNTNDNYYKYEFTGKNDIVLKNNNEKIDVADNNSDIISIVTSKSEGKIYALMKDGQSVELMDVSEYNGNVSYTYVEGKLYLHLYRYEPGFTNTETGETKSFVDYNTFGYIELTDEEYKFTKIDDIDMDVASFAVVDNIIYFTTKGFNSDVYEYDMISKEYKVSDKIKFEFSNVPVELYNLSDDTLVYSVCGTTKVESSLGTIDVKTGVKKEIATNALFEYVHDGKVVYLEFAGENKSEWKYFEYDVMEDKATQISETASSNQSIYDSYIVPVEDYYMYIDDETLVKYSNGKAEVVVDKLNDGTESIVLVSDNKLNITYGGSFESEVKNGTYDLETSEFVQAENDKDYINVLYLK